MYEIVKTKNNIKYYIFSKFDLISNRLRNQGEYQPKIFEEAKNILLKNSLEEQNKAIIDVGAHIGTFSLPLANIFDQNDYYLFEIQPEVFNLLEKNVEINKFKNIHLYNTGLSDKEETFEINLPNYTLDKNISAFSLKKQVIDNDYEVNTIGEKAKLKCKKLDDFNIENVGLIKIDVEGFELEVLRGSLETIKNSNYPPLIFESWSWKHKNLKEELFKFIKNLNYKIKPLAGGNDHLAFIE